MAKDEDRVARLKRKLQKNDLTNTKVTPHPYIQLNEMLMFRLLTYFMN